MKSNLVQARPTAALAAIITIFTLLSCCYSLVTPLMYGPDEPAHLIYIRSMALNHAAPPISHTVTPTLASSNSHEAHQPPLYYALMSIPYALLHSLDASTDTTVRVIRLLNIGIGTIWLWFVYHLAYVFFQRQRKALAVTAFVALTPLSGYMSAVINNDILIAMLFTWTLIPLLEYFKTGSISTRKAMYLGLLLGLTILTKAQGLILVAALLIAFVAVGRRKRWDCAGHSLRQLAIALSIAALMCGWWFIRNLVIYGSLMPHSLFSPGIPAGPLSLVRNPVYGLSIIRLLTEFQFGYYWAPYWTLRLFVPWDRYFRPLLAIAFLVLIGLIVKLKRDSDLDKKSLWFLSFPPAAAYLSWLHYVFTVDVGMQMQGRLFLPIAPIVGIWAAIGFDGLFANPKMKKLIFTAGLALMLAANIGVISCVVATYKHTW